MNWLKQYFRYRLLRLVSPFVAVVLLQAFVAGLSLDILSAVRAYVAGEASWSRSQKNAVYFLHLYLHSGRQSFLMSIVLRWLFRWAISWRDGHSSRTSQTLRSPGLDFCKAQIIRMTSPA